MKVNEFEEDVQIALQHLRKDGVILYPTDTIWGLGCDATNENSIEKIKTIKCRDAQKSFILLMTDVKQLSNYIANPLPSLQDILSQFIEPTTFIYENAINLTDALLAQDGSIAIRITQDPFCRSLIKRLRQPLVSTSANISTQPSPQRFYDVVDEIKEQVDYVVKWRQFENSTKKPSIIYKMHADGTYTKIR